MDDPYGTIVYGQVRDPNDIAEIFHEATKVASANFMERGLQATDYLLSRRWTVRTVANYKDYATRPELALPPPTPLEMPLMDALRRRQSVRSFSGQPIGLQDLSNILFYGAGVTRTPAVTMLPHLQMRFRSYPSGGGLYPVELYAFLVNVAGVAPCLVHYCAVTKRAAILSEDIEASTLREAFGDCDNFIPTTGAVLFLTGIFQRTTVKYGPRGYRFVMLEAGHLAQNLSLVTTAHNLGSLMWGGYLDDRLNALIEANGVDESVVHCMMVGRENV